MKPHVYRIVGILTTLTILMIGGAQAQSVTRAHVPFDFSVNETAISAGDCLISRLNDSAIIVRSTAKDGGSVFVLSQDNNKRDTSGQARWMFRRYGDTYFLVGMRMPDYSLTVSQSKTEKRLRKELRLASNSKDHPSPLKPEVLAINVTN